jgi:transposase-like protein
VLETCANKPIFLVDKGPWYPEAFQTLGLKWSIEPSARGTVLNAVQSNESQNKAVLQQLPSKEKANLQDQTLHKALRPMVQLIKPHQTLKRPPATPIT